MANAVIINPGMEKSAKSAAVVVVGDIYIHAQEIAKQLVPVVTGALRDSIVVEKDGRGLPTLAAKKEYASYVEYGTARRKAKPFIAPALMRALRDKK